MNFKNWFACTATMKRLFGVHRQYLPDYMDEQMWRSRQPPHGMIIFRHIIHATFYNRKGSQGVDQEFLRRTSQEAWGQKSPSGSRGKALVGGLGMKSPKSRSKIGN